MSISPSAIAALTAGLALTALPPAHAADGEATLKAQCSQCHALVRPEKPTLQRLWERKGPDLWYAGSKFRQEWLTAWLQNPARIRPAGAFYVQHVKPTDAADAVDESTLSDHVKLDAATAEAVAGALMALKAPDGLVEAGLFKGKKVPAAMGTMFFGKLRGCSACHSLKAGEGGASGPELGSAGDRLQPDFIASYIRNPQQFDRHVWMPRQELSDDDLQRLAGFLSQQAKGGTR